MSFIVFIKNNFLHVGPILAVGMFGLVITIERFMALMYRYPMTYMDAFFEKIRVLVMEDRVGEAVAFCERYGAKPGVAVIKEGLMRAHQPEGVIEHGIQLAVAKAQEKIAAWTPFLSTVANVATLLGLLGTIMGLVQSFEAVGAANAQTRSALLAAGISTAMNATMLGLAVAIPCMVAYSFLVSRTNKLNAQVEQAGIQTLDILKQRHYEVEAPAAIAVHMAPRKAVA